MIAGVATLAANGTSSTRVYWQFHSAAPVAPDTRKLFSVVLGNLRDQGLSGRSERNLRGLLGV